MEVIQTGIEGLVQIKPKIHLDSRGWFIELYKSTEFQDSCGNVQFVQDNFSFSNKHVLRGLHLQVGNSSQAKLVTVVKGRALDVVVDLRSGSPTFGQHYKLELNDTLKNFLFVPYGFAHGFSAIEDTWFLYKCSNEYNPKNETGIIWNDPTLNINWDNPTPIVSDKDTRLPSFQDLLQKSVISQH